MTFTVNIEHSPLLKEIHDQGRVNGARRVCFELLRELGLEADEASANAINAFDLAAVRIFNKTLVRTRSFPQALEAAHGT